MQKDCPVGPSTGMMNEKSERLKGTSKRPPSPMTGQVPKKPKESNSGRSYHCCEKSIKRVVDGQVEMLERLIFKDLECQKLRKKFDEIDRNCRRWHDFAVGLQSRVKRLALILHRQQDTIKTLQTKDVKTVSVSVQTDSSLLQTSNSNKLGKVKTETDTMIKKEYKNNVLNTSSSLKMKQAKTEKDTSPVFIDLTEEETAKTSALKFSPGNVTPVKKNETAMQILAKNHESGSYHSLNHKNSVGQLGRTANSFNNTALYVVNNSSNKATVSPSTLFSQPSNFSPMHSVDAKSRNGLQDLKNQGYKAPTKDIHAGAKKLAVLPTKNGICVKNSSMIPRTNHSQPYPPLPAPPPLTRETQKLTLPLPPQPTLKIKKSVDGIELSWNHILGNMQCKMDSYELYVYQHNPNSNSSNRWKRIGNEGIMAMPLPMACTLSQFSSGSIYYFAVRGKDIYGRFGNFSTPCCSSEVNP